MLTTANSALKGRLIMRNTRIDINVEIIEINTEYGKNYVKQIAKI